MAEPLVIPDERPSAVGGAVRGLFGGAFKGGLIGALAFGLGTAGLVVGGLWLAGVGATAMAITASVVGIGGAIVGSAGGALGGAVAGTVNGHSEAREGAALYDERQRSINRAIRIQHENAVAPTVYAPVQPVLVPQGVTLHEAAPAANSHVEALQAKGYQPSVPGVSHAAALEEQRQQAQTALQVG